MIIGGGQFLSSFPLVWCTTRAAVVDSLPFRCATAYRGGGGSHALRVYDVPGVMPRLHRGLRLRKEAGGHAEVIEVVHVVKVSRVSLSPGGNNLGNSYEEEKISLIGVYFIKKSRELFRNPGPFYGPVLQQARPRH